MKKTTLWSMMILFSILITACSRCGKTAEERKEEEIRKNVDKYTFKTQILNYHLAMDSVYLEWKKDTTQNPLGLIKKRLVPRYERFIVSYINLGKPIDSTDARWLMKFQSHKHRNPLCDISPLRPVLRRLLHTQDKYVFENIGLKKVDSVLKTLPASCPDIQTLRTTLATFTKKKDTKSLEKLIFALQEVSGFFDWQYLYMAVGKTWTNYQPEQALTPVFKRYHYFFPNRKVPPVVLFVSSLEKDSEIIADTTFIGVSMDFCLGDTFKFYQNDNFPLYLHRKFNLSAYPYTMMRRFAGLHFAPVPIKEPTFAEIMLRMGATTVFAKKMMENPQDTLLFSCSGKQMAWAYKNEPFIWKDMLPKLYSKNTPDFRQYVEVGGFTKKYGSESPGQIAMFMGHQIITSYLNKHPEITLPQLMQTTDWQKILKEAEYEPQKPA